MSHVTCSSNQRASVQLNICILSSLDRQQLKAAHQEITLQERFGSPPSQFRKSCFASPLLMLKQYKQLIVATFRSKATFLRSSCHHLEQRLILSSPALPTRRRRRCGRCPALPSSSFRHAIHLGTSRPKSARPSQPAATSHAP